MIWFFFNSINRLYLQVHQCYGEELGLTSDDEDYVAPGTEEDKLSARLSVDNFSEVIYQVLFSLHISK